MTEALRTFIALELPERIQDGLRRLQNDLKQYRLDVRWVRTENIHLTLKFLGNIQPPDVEKVAGTIAAVAGTQDVFALKISGIGVFPTIKNPRVIWSGVSGNVQSLQSLYTSLDDQLGKQGFEKETRRFKGHLTLGRAKGKIDSRRMMDAIVGCGGVSSDGFSIRRISFFQSHLQKEGPVYTRIMTAPLAEGSQK